MSSKEKSCNSCLCSSIGNYFFLLTYFRIFILIFDFLYMPKCRLFAGEVLRDSFFHSAWCFLSFLGLWSVSDINLGTSRSLPFQISPVFLSLFLSFWLSHTCMLFFLWLSHGACVFCPGFGNLHSLPFDFWGFYWGIFCHGDSFLNCVYSANKPIECILHFWYGVLFISNISFFFLSISISLLTLPIHSCMLTTLSFDLLKY